MLTFLVATKEGTKTAHDSVPDHSSAVGHRVQVPLDGEDTDGGDDDCDGGQAEQRQHLPDGVAGRIFDVRQREDPPLRMVFQNFLRCLVHVRKPSERNE